MNIVFWVLIFILAVTIWALLAFVYKPIGKLFSIIFGDAIAEMKEEIEEVEVKEAQKDE